MTRGDLIMVWIAAGGAAALVLVVVAFVVLALLERRREIRRLAEAGPLVMPSAAAVPERTIAQIAADGMSDADREAQRYARLDAWLADAGGYRRRDLATMHALYGQRIGDICESHRAALLAVYEDGALAADGFGFAVQRDRARMAALYERAHSGAEIVELAERPYAAAVDATSTREWSAAEVAELTAMLDAGQAELDAERAAVTR